jgi:hypothetical protein
MNDFCYMSIGGYLSKFFSRGKWNVDFEQAWCSYYSTGALEILHVSDPDMVKEIGHWTPSELGKPTFLKKSRKALFGGGLFAVNGDEWAYRRKIIAPELFMEKIKVLS